MTSPTPDELSSFLPQFTTDGVIDDAKLQKFLEGRLRGEHVLTDEDDTDADIDPNANTNTNANTDPNTTDPDATATTDTTDTDPNTHTDPNTDPSPQASPPTPVSSQQQGEVAPDPAQGAPREEVSAGGGQTLPPAEEFVDLGDGQQAPKELLRAMVGFDQYLARNPGLKSLIENYIRNPQAVATQAPTQAPTQQAPTQAPAQAEFTPPTPPSDLDLDDPALRALWENHVAQARSLHDTQVQISQLTQQSSQTLEQLQAQRITADIDSAVSTFQSTHSLAPDELQRVREVAARLNVLPSLMDYGVDPITGQNVAYTPPRPFIALLKSPTISFPIFSSR